MAAFVAVWMSALSASVVLVVYALASVRALSRPTLGRRGEQRRLALSRSGLFRGFEPPILQIGGWIRPLIARSARDAIERHLVASGNWLGIGPEEFLAMSVVGAIGGALGGALLAQGCDASAGWVVPGAFVGAGLPWARLRARVSERSKAAERELPAAIELLSLCLSAGADFPAALRLTLGEPEGRSAVLEELAIVQRELGLGRTRAEALQELAGRLPCDAMHGFVVSVIQAEEKGTPLAATLRVQAEVLRARRGVHAEEAAAHAGVLMILPLLLLLGCILLLLFGPFVVGGGLG